MTILITRLFGRACGFLLLASLCLAPAHAQEGASALNASFKVDARIPAPTTRPIEPRPRWERIPPIRDRSPRKFALVATAVYSAAFLDMQESISLRPGFNEHDPIARPFTHLPAPGYYAAGAVLATGVNWVAWKMARSDRLHRLWWVPQLCSIAGNMSGYTYTKTHEHSR